MDQLLSVFGLFLTASKKPQKTDAVRSGETLRAPQNQTQSDTPKRSSGKETLPSANTTSQEHHQTLGSQQGAFYVYRSTATDPGITTLVTQSQSTSRDVQSPQGAPTLKRRASISWQDSSLRNGETPGKLQQPNVAPNPHAGQGMYLLDNLQLALNTVGPNTNHVTPAPLLVGSGSAPPVLPSPAEASFHIALHAIQQLTGHTFRNTGLLSEALYVGARPIWINGKLIPEANKRLALVGDRALAMVWWDAWFYRGEARGIQTFSYIHLNETLVIFSLGTGSDRFQDVSTNMALAEAGWKYGLNNFVVGDGGFGEPWIAMKRMADTVEAIIGAVWLDSLRDMNAVKRALVGLLGADKVDSAV